MAANILDALPGIVRGTVGALLFSDAVLTREGAVSGPSHNPEREPSTDYPCRALVTEFSNYSRANGLVAAEDRKVLILGQGLAVPGGPRDGDAVTVRGESLVLVSDGGSAPAVRRDPAGATWSCRGRG